MRMWRKQLHTLDHPPLLVIVEPILTRLESGDDRMPCCRRMLGRTLARRTVAATDVPTVRTPTEMKKDQRGINSASSTPLQGPRPGCLVVPCSTWRNTAP